MQIGFFHRCVHRELLLNGTLTIGQFNYRVSLMNVLLCQKVEVLVTEFNRYCDRQVLVLQLLKLEL